MEYNPQKPHQLLRLFFLGPERCTANYKVLRKDQERVCEGRVCFRYVGERQLKVECPSVSMDKGRLRGAVEQYTQQGNSKGNTLCLQLSQYNWQQVSQYTWTNTSAMPIRGLSCQNACTNTSALPIRGLRCLNRCQCQCMIRRANILTRSIAERGREETVLSEIRLLRSGN